MRLVIIYHPDSEYAGLAEDFRRDFERLHQDRKVELVSLETTEGADLAELYDIVRYPAILVISQEGRLQKVWQDRPWPLMDEVAAYAA